MEGSRDCTDALCQDGRLMNIAESQAGSVVLGRRERVNEVGVSTIELIHESSLYSRFDGQKRRANAALLEFMQRGPRTIWLFPVQTAEMRDDRIINRGQRRWMAASGMHKWVDVDVDEAERKGGRMDGEGNVEKKERLSRMREKRCCPLF